MVDHEKELAQAERIATLLDGRKLPIGLDPLLGVLSLVLPGIGAVGDVVPMVGSVYMIRVAKRLGLPNGKVAQMIAWTVGDLIIGLIPVAGDVADFFLRSHRRNWRILRDHFRNDAST